MHALQRIHEHACDVVFLAQEILVGYSSYPTPEIDRNALTLLMRHNCIPAPYSVYQGIAKLRPGHFLVLAEGAGEPRIETYWSAKEVAELWVNMCPAHVYEIGTEGGDGTVTVNVAPSNCVQCGAITAKGGRLTLPEGGSGPEYTNT